MLATLRALDSHHGLRDKLRQVAEHNDLWAGIPMPLADEQLVVDPKYPHAKELMAIGQATTEEEVEAAKMPARVRGSFYSSYKRCRVVIFEREDGRVDWGYVRDPHPLAMALRTLGCSAAWGIEQEARAIQLLATLVSHRQFKQYMLTGTFLESSRRSGVMYVFRKLRPTVAVRMTGPSADVMCALCAHPIGYYSGSWAGAMAPSDDVVAHLQLMRADEPRFWKTSTQHPAISPLAGVF
jgi:hypothetical protein